MKKREMIIEFFECLVIGVLGAIIVFMLLFMLGITPVDFYNSPHYGDDHVNTETVNV